MEAPDPERHPADGRAAAQKPADAPRPHPDATLGRELGGDLPCVFCSYNLKGISIRAVCPECGIAVRATILSVVDPYARELQPIRRPALVAGLLMTWAAAALVAALLCWLPQIAAALREIGVPVQPPRVATPVLVCLVLSGIGATALVRPHAGIPWAHTLASVAGILLYAPLAWALWRVQTGYESGAGPAYVSGWLPGATATRLSVIASGCVAGIVLLLRPVARLLVARSLLMRTGRVDRQTMMGIAAAAGLAAAGHLLGRATAMAGPSLIGDVSRVLAIGLITTGSALVTLGLFGATVDAARIARAVLTPRLTLKQVIRSGSPGVGRAPLPATRGGIGGGGAGT